MPGVKITHSCGHTHSYTHNMSGKAKPLLEPEVLNRQMDVCPDCWNSAEFLQIGVEKYGMRPYRCHSVNRCIPIPLTAEMEDLGYAAFLFVTFNAVTSGKDEQTGRPIWRADYMHDMGRTPDLIKVYFQNVDIDEKGGTCIWFSELNNCIKQSDGYFPKLPLLADRTQELPTEWEYVKQKQRFMQLFEFALNGVQP